MGTNLPEPLSFSWELKPVSSATAGSETLPDGRTKFWVKHELLKGVTPAMLVWCFGHLEGDVEIDGRLLNRMGSLEHFLPKLNAREAQRAATPTLARIPLARVVR
jgi:hypothetical protein